MTEFVALRSLVFAAECFFGASLILLLAWLFARQGSAARRHLIWLAAFGGLLILPLAALLVPPQVIVAMPAAPPPVFTAEDLAVLASINAPPEPEPLFTLPHVLTALLLVWLAGIAAIAAKTLAGLTGLLFLHRRSVPHIPQGIDGEKFRGVRWQLRLRTTPGSEGPLAYGLFKSIVLLPKSSVRWPRERLEAVLLHEFAHVRRKDCLARFVALAACAIYWPNPFVWSAAERLKREAEMAADDMALEAGVRPSSYADALVGLARDYEHAAFAAVTLSMAERSTLKDRVQSVLSAARPRMGVTRMDMLKVAVSCLALTAGLVLVRPSLAQSKPAEPVKQVEIEIVRQDVEPPPVPDVPDLPPEPKAPPAPHAMPAPAAPPPPPAIAAPPAPPVPPSPPEQKSGSIHVQADHVVYDARDAKSGGRLVMWGDWDKDKPGHAVLHIGHATLAVPPAPPVPPVGALPPAAFHEAMKAQRIEMRRAAADMRKAHADLKRVEIEIRKIDTARFDKEFAAAMENARPAMEAAVKLHQADFKRALAEAKISEAVARAMEAARPGMEKAIDEANKSARHQDGHD